MNTLSRRAVLAGLAALGARPAYAQLLQQPLKIVFPFAAGGSADAVARAIAEQLQQSVGRPVIVENRTGAGGRTGALAVKDSQPDGTTLLFAAAAQFTLQPHVLSNLGYDPFADFVALARIMKFDQALAISGQLPAKSVSELVAWLKKNPEQTTFGSPGPGTGPHFSGLEFGRTFGIDMRHVPYRGTPAALPDLMAARLPIYIASASELIEHHRNGSVRILATTGGTRLPSLADVPTLKESGVNLEAPGWFAFYAPAGTPPAMAERLQKEISIAAAAPAVRARIESAGFQATDTSTENLKTVQRVEFEAWAGVVKAAAFKPE